MKTAPFLLILPAFLLASCETVPPGEEAPGSDACAAITSGNWAAWINAMPGPEGPRLIVTGDVTVPTGGWQVSLELGPTMRSQPPIQIVDLRLTPPGEMATQALVTHQARGRFPAYPAYRSVVVRCGDRELANISPVEMAH